MPKNSVEDLRARGIPVADIQRANEEQKLESFIEALPIAVFVTDAKGRRCHSNQLARELLRHTSLLAEDAGQVVENFEGFIENTDERYPHEQLPIVRALLGISCSIDDLEIQHAGRRIPVEVHGAPILNGRGEVIFAVASFTDITERKSLETRLRIADRMASVGTLAAGVAHEINNPLAYVMANLAFVVEELRRDFGGMAEVIEALDEARAGAERVRVIVRDLKTFSRQHQDELVPVDVRKVLEASVSIAWNEIRHRARLVKLLADVPDVMASEARLGQVCLNLLVNAAQALPVGAAEKNEIRLTTSLEAGRVVIEVADTGPGIPPEVLSRIFDPFFTTKAAGVGTGLGLSICRSIVQSLGASCGSRPGSARGPASGCSSRRRRPPARSRSPAGPQCRAPRGACSSSTTSR